MPKSPHAHKSWKNQLNLGEIVFASDFLNLFEKRDHSNDPFTKTSEAPAPRARLAALRHPLQQIHRHVAFGVELLFVALALLLFELFLYFSATASSVG